MIIKTVFNVWKIDGGVRWRKIDKLFLLDII
ncbi:hypothetical protein ES703_28554 [subsurface metagenome]